MCVFSAGLVTQTRLRSPSRSLISLFLLAMALWAQQLGGPPQGGERSPPSGLLAELGARMGRVTWARVRPLPQVREGPVGAEAQVWGPRGTHHFEFSGYRGLLCADAGDTHRQALLCSPRAHWGSRAWRKDASVSGVGTTKGQGREGGLPARGLGEAPQRG